LDEIEITGAIERSRWLSICSKWASYRKQFIRFDKKDAGFFLSLIELAAQEMRDGKVAFEWIRKY
jgi:hypothetical protein